MVSRGRQTESAGHPLNVARPLARGAPRKASPGGGASHRLHAPLPPAGAWNSLSAVARHPASVSGGEQPGRQAPVAQGALRHRAQARVRHGAQLLQEAGEGGPRARLGGHCRRSPAAGRQGRRGRARCVRARQSGAGAAQGQHRRVGGHDHPGARGLQGAAAVAVAGRVQGQGARGDGALLEARPERRDDGV
eukprot:1887674-Prymnesium_polylepis.1